MTIHSDSKLSSLYFHLEKLCLSRSAPHHDCSLVDGCRTQGAVWGAREGGVGRGAVGPHPCGVHVQLQLSGRRQVAPLLPNEVGVKIVGDLPRGVQLPENNEAKRFVYRLGQERRLNSH
jgi:hypothetical protein